MGSEGERVRYKRTRDVCRYVSPNLGGESSCHIDVWNHAFICVVTLGMGPGEGGRE